MPAASASASCVSFRFVRTSRTFAPKATASGAFFFLGGIRLYIATASIKLTLAVASTQHLRLTLSTFAVLVLRQRAKDRNVTVSAVVEPLIIEGVMLDEVERMVKQSPKFARIAKEWMRDAAAKRK